MPESPDGLNTLSVNSDLTSNPLTGVPPRTGMIKIVSAEPTGNECRADLINVRRGLRWWLTWVAVLDFTGFHSYNELQCSGVNSSPLRPVL